MKEPGLFRQLIAIHYEQAKRRKALRQLAKVEWTWEFLESVITHSAQLLNKNIQVTIETKSGNKFTLSSVTNKNTSLSQDNDIFNHLDDEAAVQEFIRENTKR